MSVCTAKDFPASAKNGIVPGDGDLLPPEVLCVESFPSYSSSFSPSFSQLGVRGNRNLTLGSGGDKNRMQFIGHIAYSSSPERPTNFEGTESFWWLTKKVKK
jgi:hypothetical protein